MSVALSGRLSALLIPLGLMLAAPPAEAVILPSNITVSTPAGSTDTSSPFTDDVLLGSLTFGTNNVYDGTTGSFSVAQQFEVITGRSQINAEWGDSDDGTDGNDNPFVKADIVNAGDPISTGPGGLQETTDPADQDAALLNAFNSRSLSEITDGEGGSLTVFKVLFEQSLAFDDVGGDGLPDIVFFERGLNDVFEVQLITGGSFAAPSLSDPVIVDSGDFADAGFDIDTVEISGGQSMGVGGFDLADFGLGAGESAFGFRLSNANGSGFSGPDLGGFFLAAEDPENFQPPLDGEPEIGTVPVPGSGLMLLGALAFGAYGRWRGRSV